jgi:tetratricopeptide (TPR) repeat protein
MVESQPGRQAELHALVQACKDNLRAAQADELQRAFARPSAGEGSETTPEQAEAVYQTACRLCDEGNFRFATALALHLVAFNSGDPRFNFMAGTCMQRLGLPGDAGRFFCMTLIHGGDNPAALYRLGECLLALGDKENAGKALEAAIDVAREVKEGLEVQAYALSLIESVKAGSRSQLGKE